MTEVKKTKKEAAKQPDHGPDALIVLKHIAKHENNLRAIQFFTDRGISFE